MKKMIEKKIIAPFLPYNLISRFPKALVLYLEHLIFEQEVESEEFHTHLALLYYERLLEFTTKEKIDNDYEIDDDKKKIETELRQKFRLLLKTSRLLRMQLLLGKLKSQEHGFEYEEALLHAKLGDYTSALKVG